MRLTRGARRHRGGPSRICGFGSLVAIGPGYGLGLGEPECDPVPRWNEKLLMIGVAAWASASNPVAVGELTATAMTPPEPSLSTMRR